ncbi:DeoR/GlpR family DNA-binding transcription regulator [Alloyangia pacifica]|uniref:DeoR/GlpR family DNA-binding transcription regulator n=1 Tax=Alloyangia pacifica TaxID=311180 RepID=UPI001CFD766A|nr:DeoR/GlpR family DNA-binding transcription regulator [Alloyangia pacifica]
MWHDARHRMILDHLDREGAIGIAQIVAQTGVSRETARRDLSELQARGLLRRCHGGAVRPGAAEPQPEPNFGVRLMEAAEAKQRIAERAVALLPQRSHCFIDAGSTTAILAKALLDRTDLTIVTNSLPIARTLTCAHRVTLLGGELDKDRQGTYGALTVEAIRRYHLDFAIIAPVAVDAAAGLTNYSMDEALVARAMVEHAGHTIALAHAAKLGRQSRARVCGLGSVNTLISDQDDIADRLGGPCPECLRVLTAGPEPRAPAGTVCTR